MDLLRDLDLDSIPCLRVFNKVDLLDENQQMDLPRFDGVCISALDEKSLPPFLERAGDKLDGVINRSRPDDTDRGELLREAD